MASSVTYALFQRALPDILSHMPKSWTGTTFSNQLLLGRRGFADNLCAAVEKRSQLSEESLAAVGESEDYLRVASNVSTMLELGLALEKQLPIDHVFTFASQTMPIVAVCLTTLKTVDLYVGGVASPFAREQLEMLHLLRCHLVVHAHAAPAARAHADHVVLTLENVWDKGSDVDGVVGDNTLFIIQPERIDHAQILVRRKRLATPMTTPAALERLHVMAGLPSLHSAHADAKAVSDFYAHLQRLSGAEVSTIAEPICCTAGLPMLASLWIALIGTGGLDVAMASTAYGGSSQVTDLLCEKTGRLRKHTFDVQGDTGMEASIRTCLDGLAAKGAEALLPTTVLFVEVPTNPDMKVPNLSAIAAMLRSYTEKTGTQILLLIDATFAPNSRQLQRMHELAPEINSVVFLSLSKSVSRGKTTGGTLIFNTTAAAIKLRADVLAAAALLDVHAKPDQMLILTENHSGVEERNDKAYAVAKTVGEALCATVKKHTSHEMKLAFVTPEAALLGVTSPTFSFNLPPIPHAAAGVNEGLAQRFVDLIAGHREWFKPCVSFGQDNDLVYATVPATSTQGAIKEEDKAKQAQGGVQLVRLSFPPTVDVDAVNRVIESAVFKLYHQ